MRASASSGEWAASSRVRPSRSALAFVARSSFHNARSERNRPGPPAGVGRSAMLRPTVRARVGYSGSGTGRAARRCRELAGSAARDRAKLEELGRAEKELTQALQPVQFFSLVAQEEIVAAQERARLASDLAENLAAASSLFEVVERSARLLRDPLAGALSELKG